MSTWQPANITKIVDYDFAIMKASEGLMVARHCDKQYQAARKRGKKLGVYHFAAPGDPIKQADFFVKNVKGYVGEAILVLDLEASALTQWGPAGAKKWMDRVELLTGSKPMLYVMGSARSRFGNIEGDDYALWQAIWNSRTTGGFHTPPTPASSPWAFSAIHQYTDRGHLPGYAGDLDLNIFHGDRAAWDKYAQSVKHSAPKPPKKPKPTKPSSKPKPEPKKKLVVDGLNGTATNRRFQEVLGTPADGRIDHPSLLVMELQRVLNKRGRKGLDGKPLKVDGLGFDTNVAHSVGPTHTIHALQEEFGMKVKDGILSHGPKGSPTIKVLQRRLNKGKF